MRISDWSSDVCSSDLAKQTHGSASEAECEIDGGAQVRLVAPVIRTIERRHTGRSFEDVIGANGVAIIRRKNGAGPVILLTIAASDERQSMLPHRLIVAVAQMGERQVRRGGETGLWGKQGQRFGHI